MRQSGYTYVIAAVLIVIVTASVGQTQNLSGRSRIELGLGMAVSTQTGVAIGIGGVETELDAGGFLGSIGFSHWLQEDVAATFQLNTHSLDIGTDIGIGGVNTHTAFVSSIFMGLRYYLPKSTYGTGWRPYLSAAVGPVMGSESKVEVGTVVVAEENNEIAFGGRLGIGMDIVLSRLFMMGVFTGYNLMTDFSDPVGGRTNHSGPDFGVSISLLLGKGAE